MFWPSKHFWPSQDSFRGFSVASNLRSSNRNLTHELYDSYSTWHIFCLGCTNTDFLLAPIITMRSGPTSCETANTSDVTSLISRSQTALAEQWPTGVTKRSVLKPAVHAYAWQYFTIPCGLLSSKYDFNARRFISQYFKLTKERHCSTRLLCHARCEY
jgi:hypothetical protein